MIHGVTYILNNNVAFQGLVGQNVAATKYKAYPLIAPQDEKAPYSICRMTSMRLQYKGRSVFEGQFQVMSYHINYDDVYALDNAVTQALVPISGTYNGVNFGYIEHEDTSDDIAETYGILYVKTSTFNYSITITALT